MYIFISSSSAMITFHCPNDSLTQNKHVLNFIELFVHNKVCNDLPQFLIFLNCFLKNIMELERTSKAWSACRQSFQAALTAITETTANSNANAAGQMLLLLDKSQTIF